MKTKIRIGSIFIILGVIMLLFAVTLYSYKHPLNPLLSQLGKWSFILWFPSILVGAVLNATLGSSNK